MPTTPEPEPERDDDDDLSPPPGEPLARACAAPVPGLPVEPGRVTVRRRTGRAEAPAGGVSLRWLYRALEGRMPRPGEPRAVCVIELEAGARLGLPAGGPREFLVLRGSAEVDGEVLGLRDFLLLPAGARASLASTDGAHVFVREAAPGTGIQRTLVRDREAGWPEFAPGIRRRVLWTASGEAALLYRADPGASVPCHQHGHDEECLMLQGELVLDDVLLQPGDYQLAPAGTGHRLTETDTGVILYAHGDLDLQLT